jgi:hypothetical protein
MSSSPWDEWLEEIVAALGGAQEQLRKSGATFASWSVPRWRRAATHRLIDAETAQTEIQPMIYQQKCAIAPDAADFGCPEIERAVEKSRRWDPILLSGMYLPDK